MCRVKYDGNCIKSLIYTRNYPPYVDLNILFLLIAFVAHSLLEEPF